MYDGSLPYVCSIELGSLSETIIFIGQHFFIHPSPSASFWSPNPIHSSSLRMSLTYRPAYTGASFEGGMMSRSISEVPLGRSTGCCFNRLALTKRMMQTAMTTMAPMTMIKTYNWVVG